MPRPRNWLYQLAHSTIKDKARLTEEDWNTITAHFKDYLLITADKVLIFKQEAKLGELTIPGKSRIAIPYKHRFKKREIAKKELELDMIIEVLVSWYDIAVFTTITPNPNTTLREQYQGITKALNNLNRKLEHEHKQAIPYIALVEPQRDGKPHIHLIHFGISRIEDYRKLSKLLEEWGAGKITWIKQLRKGKNGWNLEGRNIGPLSQYLKKYLKKALRAYKSKDSLKVLAWYWALNARFYTTSRIRIKEVKQKTGQTWILETITTIWIIIREGIEEQLINPQIVEEILKEHEELTGLLGPPENERHNVYTRHI